jgi:EmrB/QacA subfamily drug resistance transporter
MLQQDDRLRLGSPAGRLALAATVAASASAFLDATIVNVALPDIGADLHAEVSELQWVINGYLLTMASFILLGGALGDRYGRRRVFRIGAAWFAVASLGCGLAPDAAWLIAARLAQGVGGALLAPTALAILQSGFVPDDRARAVGAWSGLGGLAGAVGPLLGGLLVDGPGWRWAFLLSLPLAGFAAVAVQVVPETRDDAHPGRFDWPGAGLAAVGLATLTWVLIEAPEAGYTDARLWAVAAVGGASAVAFVVQERRAPAPLVPPHLFRSRTFTVLNLATFTLYGALTAQFLLLVLQLQTTASWSALAAGSSLLPATLIMLVGSARSGDAARRRGPRTQLIVGPFLVAVSLVWLSAIGADAEWVSDVLPGAVLYGLGLVLFVAPLTAAVMASVDEEHVSTGSGVNNAVARTGGLFAVAVLPAASGLSTAVGPDEVTEAYRIAMLTAAVLAAMGAAIVAVALPRTVPLAASPRRFHCPVDAAPAQPDPRECRVSVRRAA